MKCWAAGLGGCGGGQSGEHLISANVWSGPSIDVQGFRWCKDKAKQISVPSLTSNILCRDHNSDLSQVDTSGGEAFRTLGEAVSLATARSRVAHVDWLLRCYAIDGMMLERWFLKSLINLHLAQDDCPVWPGGVKQFAPPLWMVRAAYGAEPLVKPMGLYSVAFVGEQTAHRDGVEFGPLFTTEDVLVGGVFKFVGYRFMLSLFPGELPRELAFTNDPRSDWFKGEPFYHIRRWNHDVGGRRSHFVDINWPGVLSDHYAA